MATQTEKERPRIRYDELWLSSWLRLFLITGLVACLDLAFVFAVRRGVVIPSPRAELLLLLPVLGAFVGALSTTVLARPEQRLRRTTGYRLAELALLISITRAVIWWVDGTWPSFSQLIYRPLDTVFDGFFLLVTALLTVSWMLAAAVTGDFLEMALQPDELLDRSGVERGWTMDGRAPSDRMALLRRFVERWIVGGIWLLLVAASSQVGPRPGGFVTVVQQPIPGSVMAAVLGYFLLGLVLLAIGRLAVLRARWQLGGTASRQDLLLSWPVYALGVLLVVGLVAMLLPLGGTFRLAQILWAVIQAVYLVLYTLLGLILALFALLLYGSVTEEQATPPPPQATPPPAQDLPPLIAPPPWLGGALFWAVALLLVGYAGYVYLQDRGFRLSWLVALWRQIWSRWLGVQETYRAWRTGMSAEEEGAAGRRGRRRRGFTLRLSGLSPAEQVRRLYLAMVAEAAEHGVPRRPGETPYRYAPRLAEQVPLAEEEVHRLTEAFVAVRYAHREPDEAGVGRLRQAWRRLQAAIRDLGR